MLAYLKNILTRKCPRCHEGDLFTHKWYELKDNNKMKSHCAVCGQRTELEPGFYHGTGYVSYALTVGFSILTFVLWITLTDIGIRDKRIFWWLIINVVLLILLQPWVMRTSRVLWLSWFFHDDDHHYAHNKNKS
ncbi:DUF983 domain-containing protein [Flavobacterium phycosphaerae]|uniref:DUF983 domain-containing protein n=1 Tax=Flavobacterium phycosphaerae TaxID=2697515 RepID=UPI001389E9F8|nr:DUF983 domain-containing protein [Flavobacterium phycosphaerae]